jgi:hypothetical protein
MLLDGMITAAATDLNGIEFVSRDVERLTKKNTGSDSWIGCAMRRILRGKQDCFARELDRIRRVARRGKFWTHNGHPPAHNRAAPINAPA